MSDVFPHTGRIERIGLRYPASARARDYALLMKPRVMSLVVFTGIVGLVMAPGAIDLWTATVAVLCIALGAGAAGAVNMWYDRDIDAFMARTRKRPLPDGRVAPVEALWLGIAASIISVITMTLAVNPMAGTLLAATIAYYVFIYTIWLKRRTPQNIVVGGASGAFPPMIGWAAVTGGVDWGSAILFLIIFIWTPPHFWALALYRTEDYRRVNVPMLPVVAGEQETRRQILIYTLVLVPVTLMPYAIGMTSIAYLVVATLFGARLVMHAVSVWRDKTTATARPMFRFTIAYLAVIFFAMLADKGLAALI